MHQSVLQAIAGMSSRHFKWLLKEYRYTLMASLGQHIQHIEPLVPSPDVERELELYYRAHMLLRPNRFLGGRLGSHLDHMADRCCNEQLTQLGGDYLWMVKIESKSEMPILGKAKSFDKSLLGNSADFD